MATNGKTLPSANKMANNPLINKGAKTPTPNNDLQNKLGKKQQSIPRQNQQPVYNEPEYSEDGEDFDDEEGLGGEDGGGNAKQPSQVKQKLAEGAKNIAKTLMSKSNDPKEILKKKIILAVAAAVAKFFLIIIAVVVVIIVLAGPITAVMNVINGVADSANEFGEKLGNFFTFKGFNTNKETFYNALNDKYVEYIGKGIEIDIPLIVSSVFYGRDYDPNAEYTCIPSDTEKCDDKSTSDYSKMRKEVILLADNYVVDSGKKTYYCKYQEITGYEGNNPILGPELTKKCDTSSYIDCGCQSTNFYSEPIYEARTQDSYGTWLKAEYLPDRLKDIELTKWKSSHDGSNVGFEDYYATINESAEVEDMLASIYQRRDIYLLFAENAIIGSTNQTYGDFMDAISKSNTVPSEILPYLGNPLGDQPCNQGSCFGVYRYYPTDSLFSCAIHNGVDMTSPDTNNAIIYSIGDGQITAMTDYVKQCIPGDGQTSGCSGRSIQITHNINVNGKIYKVYSSYVHLKSFANATWITSLRRGETISITKGQPLGIMGTTGRSTGIHLHFGLKIYNDATRSTTWINPEELLKKQVCNVNPICAQARTLCVGKEHKLG